MDVKAFFANLGPTMLLAFGGTVLSTFVVGGLVFAAGQAKLCYPLGGLASLFFGALISATDPVTVLAVFTRIGVQRDVFAIVFGESVARRAIPPRAIHRAEMRPQVSDGPRPASAGAQ